MKIMLPIVGILLAGIAALSLYLFKQGLEEYVANQSLAAVQIGTPAGVEVLDYDAAQGQFLTGRELDPDPEATGPVNTLLRRFDASANGADDGVARVFVKGEERAALSIRRAPYEEPATTLAGRLGLEEPDPQPEPELDVFGTVGGIEVIRRPAPDLAANERPVSYRMFESTIGAPSAPETIEIIVLTNGSDAFVASVFAGLDLVGLNERLPEPDTFVVADADFVANADGPLSQSPPPPSVAIRAFDAMQGNSSLSSADRQILEQIRRGEISDFADLIVAFPDLTEPTAPVLAVLGNPTTEMAARLTARRLLVDNRNWSPIEAYILSQVALPGTTQDDLSEYLTRGEDLSDEVQALVAAIP